MGSALIPAARHIPNLISGLRLLLVPPVVMWILEEQPLPALVVFLIAGISDGVDGFLAKRYGWQSQLGGFLDGIADKLLLMGAMLALAWVGYLPAWLVAAAFCRDAVIVAGAIAYRVLIGRFQPDPSHLSKLNTVCQLGVVAVALTAWLGLGYPAALISGLYWVSLALIVSSGVGYVVVWGRRARAASA